MRVALPALVAVTLTIACTRVLGIEGEYELGQAEALASGGSPGSTPDAGAAPDATPGSGGSVSGGEGGGGPVAPPWTSAGGRTTSGVDGGQSCGAGQQWCGTCLPIDPDLGCGAPGCAACPVAPAGGVAICTDTGCDFACEPGLTRNAAAHTCDPMPPAGAGGTDGAGGAPEPPPEAGGAPPAGAGGAPQTSGGAPGSGGNLWGNCSNQTCPNCPGFEGCCIPPAPPFPAHCGCYYFPPVCSPRI